MRSSPILQIQLLLLKQPGETKAETSVLVAHSHALKAANFWPLKLPDQPAEHVDGGYREARLGSSARIACWQTWGQTPLRLLLDGLQ